MNKIILIGHLTKDPDLRYTPNGTAVVNFTLAVNRNFVGTENKKEADFIPIVVWSKSAENCAKYLAKGKQAAVEGRLQIRTFEGNDGNKKWVTEVVAEHVEFLSPSGNGKKGNQPDGNESPHTDLGEEITFEESDVPF